MLTCDKCSTELPDGASYCFKCGARVGKGPTEKFEVDSEDLVRRIKDLLHQGNVTKILVHDEEGRLLLELPVTAGLIGAVLAPWLAAVGAIAALVTKCTISVERRD